MGVFNPDHVYDAGSEGASLDAARKDLQTDFPDSHVFIWLVNQSPGAEVIWAAPPVTAPRVVGGRFEIHATSWFVRTYGFYYIIFSEGEIRYNPSGWKNHTEPVKQNGDRFTFERLDGKQSQKKSSQNVNPARWMEELRNFADPNLPLSGLSIPGTHNSHARAGTTGSIPVASSSAVCQSHSVADQLDMGVRSFDFRLGYDFSLRHGRVGLPGRLPDVLNIIHSFISTHNHETIMVRVEWDMEDLTTGYRHPEPKDLRKQIEDLFFSYEHTYKDAALATLGNSAGKMVLDGWHPNSGQNNTQPAAGVLKESLTAENTLILASNTIAKATPLEKKWQEIVDTVESILSSTNLYDGKWYGVGLNAYFLGSVWDVVCGKWLTPENFAQYENPRFEDYLGRYCLTHTTCRLGLVNLDFAEKVLVEKIFMTNFP